MRWWRTNACERALHLISLGLDGESSQLEQAALDRHLADCARCRAAAVDLGAFTALLRQSPLVELERPVALPAPARSRARVARRAAAAVAFAVVAAVAALGGVLLSSNAPAPRSALAFRNHQEQQRFAHLEARRLEPAVFIAPKPTVPSFAPRVLV
jgi:anti-sigma factor RsiW